MPDVTAETPRPGTSNPHRSRMRALKVLFQADLRDKDPSLTIAEIALDPAAVALLDDTDTDDSNDSDGDTSPDPRDLDDDYARRLVAGVATRGHRLDEIIGRFSRRWDVDRMPVVDRNILRLAVWELLFEDTSPVIVIDEALEMAKELSTDRSHRFINGILESVRREADSLVAETTGGEDSPSAPDTSRGC